MAMEPRQRGRPTYYHAIVRAVFEGADHYADLYDEIVREAQTMVKGQFEYVDTQLYPRTVYGPNVDLIVRDGPFLKYELGIFLDGWKIQLYVHNTFPGKDIKQKVFADANRSDAWTQETEKLPNLLAELAREAREAIRWEPKQ